MVAILFITLVVCMVLSVPIAVSIGISTIVAFWADGHTSLFIVAQRMFTSMDSTVLLAIPMFIFTGKVMAKGGISQRIINLSYETVGFMPGSLGIVSVMSCMFFAALSGSAPATVAAIGSIMIPTMIDDGYPPGFAAALCAAGGVIGCILPPSIPFVNYGLLSGESVGDLFMAGVVPGMIMGAVLCLTCFFMAKKNNWGRELRAFDFKQFTVALKKSILAILMPFIILGGIYTGFFTPTEAAAVACIYGLFVAGVIYRDIVFTDIYAIAWSSAKTSCTILFIIGTAGAFSWIITTEQVPALVTNFISGITESPFIVLMLINILLLVNGCFMEETATTFIFTPILLPLATSVGVDPVHFGVIMVMNMTIGLITPPLGINLFVAQNMDDRITFGDTVKAVMPLFLGELIVLLLVTYFPVLSLGLGNLLSGIGG